MPSRSAASSRRSIFVLCCMVLSAGGAFGQAASSGADPSAGAHGTGPVVTPVQGFNLSVDFTTQHNSSTGFANILTPDVSYRFDEHFLASASVPWYLSVNNYMPVTSNGTTTNQLVSTTNVFSDAVLQGEFEASHRDLNYAATAAMGLPSGNATYGLSAKQVTYNVTSHVDYQLGPFDPEFDVGEGDSSNLTGLPIHKPYTAVGPLLNAELGTAVDLPLTLSFDAEVYEDLPLGNQTIYGTVTRRKKNGQARSRQVLAGSGAAEDNGIIADLDIPVGHHFMVTGTYERGILQGLDTFAAGVTYTLRRPKITMHHANNSSD